MLQFELSVNQGTGNLTGDLTKTLKKGETQLVFEDLIYDKAEDNVWLLAEVIDGFATGRLVMSNPFNVLYSLPDQFQVLFDVEVYLLHPDVEYMRAHHRNTINVYQRDEDYQIKEPDFYHNPNIVFEPVPEAGSIIFTGTGSLLVEDWNIGPGIGTNKDYITGRTSPEARKIKIVLSYKDGVISMWFVIETTADIAFYYQYGWDEDPVQNWVHEWNIHTSYSEAHQQGLKDWKYNIDGSEIIAIHEDVRIDSYDNEVKILIEVSS